MLKLGQKVYIIDDHFEQNLPLGEYGYIIAYERNQDNVFDYVVRVPKTSKHYFVVDADVEMEEVLLELEADRVEREALIDFALATRNEELFRRVMNGAEELDLHSEEEEPVKDLLSQEDFIKQINLKAWI
ncbi:ATPase [Paenibacillus swuensis]|uniref:ATPase n=1 Tax=Paenibacillus swuensis TaxID=1178515 RepID=A0A172TDL9_9BACL|nr:ATPase [Paenibacillus swuensis]ANE45128.1 ATPase [Paenibacillus swuensis]